LRVAKLRFAQQAGGYDKKRDDQHAHHIRLSLSLFSLACHTISFPERAE
jgi:hypothetical protein